MFFCLLILSVESLSKFVELVILLISSIIIEVIIVIVFITIIFFLGFGSRFLGELRWWTNPGAAISQVFLNFLLHEVWTQELWFNSILL